MRSQRLEAKEAKEASSLVPRPNCGSNPLGLIVPQVRSGTTGGVEGFQKIQPHFEHIYGYYWLSDAF